MTPGSDRVQEASVHTAWAIVTCRLGQELRTLATEHGRKQALVLLSPCLLSRSPVFTMSPRSPAPTQAPPGQQVQEKVCQRSRQSAWEGRAQRRRRWSDYSRVPHSSVA